MKSFLKITKTKLVLVLAFATLSFVTFFVMRMLHTIIIPYHATEKEMIYFIEYVFPAIFLLLTILKFYLFACVAVYLIEKSKTR